MTDQVGGAPSERAWDVLVLEYVAEFDPSHPDANPETGMREWARAELDAHNAETGDA